jgi:hypothetical protein
MLYLASDVLKLAEILNAFVRLQLETIASFVRAVEPLFAELNKYVDGE